MTAFVQPEWFQRRALEEALKQLREDVQGQEPVDPCATCSSKEWCTLPVYCGPAQAMRPSFEIEDVSYGK